MEEVFYLISGAIILVVTIYDFFYTTLSGSGEAFITRSISKVSHFLTQKGIGLFGRRVFSISGMLTNLLVLGTWVLLVWLGLFLMFSSYPEALVDSNGIPASGIERLYYTGYTLSTLGLGDFKPITPFCQLLTSIFSFYGFVFFTTSMTYLLSLSSALIHKRTTALSIHNLGNTPSIVAQNIREMDSSSVSQRFANLRVMIDRHYISHQAYPVLHYFGNTERESSFSLNLAILDEAISMVLYSPGAQGAQVAKRGELLSLRYSITHFIKKMQQKYSRALVKEAEPDIKLPEYEGSDKMTDETLSLCERRDIISKILKNEGFRWHDVFTEGK